MRDGMLQPVTTTAGSLVPLGEPFRDRPDIPRRSGVPEGLVTTDHVPGRCTCSWTYRMGKLTLKYSNTACPLLSDHRRGRR